MEKQDRSERMKQFRTMSMAVMIPMIMVACPLIGYFLGFFLDKIFHTGPYLSYILLAIGIFSGVRETYVIIKKISR